MKTKRDMCETPGEGKRDEKIWLHQTIYIYIFDIFEYIYISTNEMRSLRTVHSYSGKKLSKRKSEI